MKTFHVAIAILAIALFGCSPKSSEIVEVNGVETSTNQGALQCVSLGEDEFGTPHSEIHLLFGGLLEKVGECMACQEISIESFDSYDIPKNALSACGGWWAGGGDYFYSILAKDGSIEVYFGWQDEEQEDDGYHWELKYTHPK